MPKKKKTKKSKAYNIDEEVIIGYNIGKKKTSPPKKKNNSNKKKTSKKNNKTKNNTTVKKQNPIEKKKKWDKIKRIMLILLRIILILTVIFGVIAFLFISPVFNITKIKVENASKISENTYISLSEIEIEENIFKISKSRIRELIKEEPYVEEVEVKRELPGTVSLIVTERMPSYMIEKSGMYIYIDKNGYALETSTESLDLPILKGVRTDLDNLKMGERLLDEDLAKFNDLIKIIDSVKNNDIEELTSIDISNENSYVLGFETEKKEATIGDTSNLSTKMLWIKYFIEKRREQNGTIHIEGTNIYFAPEEKGEE